MHKNSKFYIYSKTGCGYCNRLVQFMETKGLSYETFSLGKDFTTEEFLTKFGRGSTFPQVYHDNTSIGGMKDTVRYIAEHHLV